jgi:hypothetical protein
MPLLVNECLVVVLLFFSVIVFYCSGIRGAIGKGSTIVVETSSGKVLHLTVKGMRNLIKADSSNLMDVACLRSRAMLAWCVLIIGAMTFSATLEAEALFVHTLNLFPSATIQGASRSLHPSAIATIVGGSCRPSASSGRGATLVLSGSSSSTSTVGAHGDVVFYLLEMAGA